MNRIKEKEEKERQLKRVMERAAKLQDELKMLREQLRIRKSCLRVREVADLLGVCPDTVKRMAKEGILRGFNSPPRGWWWITRRSLQALHDKAMNSKSARNGQNTPTPG